MTDTYVQDSSGTIENEELAGFLKDLLSLAKKVADKLSHYLQNHIIWMDCSTRCSIMNWTPVWLL